MKRLIFLLISLLATSSCFAGSHSVQVATSGGGVAPCTNKVYTSYTTNGGDVVDFSRYHENGASPFVAGNWGNICAVRVFLIAVGTSTQTVNFGIYTDSSGSPSETRVGALSENILGSEVGGTETGLTKTMLVGEALTNTATYWVRGITTEKSTNYIKWISADGTTEGIKTADNDALPTWTSASTTKVYKFELYTQ